MRTLVLLTAILCIVGAVCAAPAGAQAAQVADPAGEQQSDSDDGASAQPDARVLAEAERRFRRAEVLGRRAERVRFPTPRRVTSSDKLTRWVQDRFAPALQARAEATQRAVAAYEAVHRAGLTRYSVAAARRIGDLYWSIAEALVGVPVPVELQRDPQLLEVYRSMIEEQAAPLRERAFLSYEACLEFARTLGQTTGPHLGHAEAQLRQHAPERLAAHRARGR